MKKILWIIIVLLIIAVAIFGGWKSSSMSKITPDAGNENQKLDKIKITSPRPGQVITSPLTITGQARGSWFFEATFPVVLKSADGTVLAQGIANAEGDWMTEEFVPFKSVLNYPVSNQQDKKGTLILQKDNPSGDPANDDSLEIPVVID